MVRTRFTASEILVLFFSNSFEIFESRFVEDPKGKQYICRIDELQPSDVIYCMARNEVSPKAESFRYEIFVCSFLGIFPGTIPKRNIFKFGIKKSRLRLGNSNSDAQARAKRHYRIIVSIRPF